ncbi:MAG: CRISPR-associated helicase/endonuclease Cas3 [Crocinitomicaceae bacterium]
MEFRPYPHQTKVADLMLAGKNIILQAPTGAGKTRAALMPFLEHFHPDSDAKDVLPTKCIYTIPMKVLAKQFNLEYSKIVKEYSLKIAKDISVAIQTGDQATDRKLESNLIFATIDQALSSFLIAPYSLSKRQANMNAGAVISSYLVFDEFHLFDPTSTLPTTLHMLKMLKGITPFILMTATFSETMLSALAEELDAVVVGTSPEEKAEFAQLGSQDKTRIYHTVDDVMRPPKIIDDHSGRTLVICNQVARAKQIYDDLKSELLAQNKAETQLLLLHSRFLADDRNAIEKKIRDYFGRGEKEDDYILVTTQAIEVGVDITSTALHTELAPANAIIQRAGRCARYQKDKGNVYIYKKALDKEGEEIDLTTDVMPYKTQEDVITKTWLAFEAYDTQVLNYEAEQVVLNRAHQEQDARIINDLKGQSRNHRQLMYSAMRGQDDARSLVREIIAQSVTIHDNPAEVAKNPFAYPSFSLHPGTLQKYIDEWMTKPAYQHTDHISIIRLNESETDAQANDERYFYEAITDAGQAWMAPLLVVHPDLATYDSEYGFDLQNGGNWIAENPKQEQDTEQERGYSYRLETYEEHIQHVYTAFKTFWTEAQWTANRLEQSFGWKSGSITKAAQLAVLLHDVGKLSKKWQKWVRDYQQMLYDTRLIDKENLAQSGQAYAHTDFLHTDDRYRDIQKKMGKRPWHAVEGAYAVWEILMAELDDNEDLTQAVYTAIARHHTAQSSQHQTYQLETNSAQHIANSIEGILPLPDLSELYGISELVNNVDSESKQLITKPKKVKSLLTYMLIVRALRRADSKGTAQGRIASE